MSNHQNGGSVPAKLIHAVIALGLEENISYGQSLIHNEYLRIHGHIHGESKSYEHTAGIAFYRLVHKVPDICKVQDFLKLLIHLLLCEAHHGSVHVDILNTGIIRIKPGTKLKKGTYYTLYVHLTI